MGVLFALLGVSSKFLWSG